MAKIRPYQKPCLQLKGCQQKNYLQKKQQKITMEINEERHWRTGLRPLTLAIEKLEHN